MAELFRIILDSGEIPALWKTSVVVPIFKKGNSEDCSDCRPISLTCTLSRTLERLVVRAMLHFYAETSFFDEMNFDVKFFGLCMAHKVLHNNTSIDPAKHFTRSTRHRFNSLQLLMRRHSSKTQHNFFVRTINTWNSLPDSTVTAQKTEASQISWLAAGSSPVNPQLEHFRLLFKPISPRSLHAVLSFICSLLHVSFIRFSRSPSKCISACIAFVLYARSFQ